MDEKTPPTQWPLGRVLEIHPGPDNLVRAVTIKCKNGIYKREIKKVCQLPGLNSPSSTENTIDKTSNCSTIRLKEEPQKLNVNSCSTNNSARDFMRGINTEHIKQLARPLREMMPPPKKRRITIYPASSSALAHTLMIVATTVAIFSMGAQGTVSITPIQSPGLFFAHDHTTILQQGVWQLQLNTNLNVSKEIAQLVKCITTFEDVCAQAKQLAKEIQCDSLASLLREEIQYMIHKIKMKVNKHRRTKRSKGIFGFLSELFFGSSEQAEIDHLRLLQEEQGRRSSNVMMGTLEAVKAFKHSSQKRYNIFQEKLQDTISHINKMQNWYTSIDHSRIEIYLLATYEAALATAQDTWNNFEDIFDLGIMTEEELKQQVQDINHQLPPQMTIPSNINIVELRALVTQRITTSQDTITICISIPIFNVHQFEVFKVIGIPDTNTSSIIYVEHEYIAVNQQLMVYFYPDPTKAEQHINTGTTVMSQQKYIGLEGLDCTSAHIFKKMTHAKSLCRMVDIQPNYDKWIALPQPHSYIYYTTTPDKIGIVCNQSRFETKELIALIRTSPDCEIASRTVHIPSSLNVDVTGHNVYFQSHNISTSHLNDALHIHKMTTMKNLSSTASKEADTLNSLEDEARNITPQDQQTVHPWIIVTIVACGITIVVLLIIVWRIYKPKKTDVTIKRKSLSRSASWPSFTIKQVNSGRQNVQA